MVAGVLFGCAALICYIVVHGDDQNTLHTSALSWAFMLSASMLGGYLFGVYKDNQLAKEI